MKITLTNEEAHAIARDRITSALTASFIGMKLNIEVGIEGPEVATTVPLQKIINDIQSLNYDTTQKIQAIKKLRELVPGMGLADAKWAVENWAQWCGTALRLNRVPHMTSLGASGNYGYKLD